jgi:hypothetical protein
MGQLKASLTPCSLQESLFLVLQYLPPGVIALVNFLGPQLFVVLVQLENYPPSTEVNLTLVWWATPWGHQGGTLRPAAAWVVAWHQSPD